MLRRFGAFLLGAVVGVGLGVVLGFLVYPFVFRPPVATETLAATATGKPVARGTFIHADPGDRFHWGQGDVTVHAGNVFLEKSFKVGPGPLFHVYLVPKAKIRTSADVKGTMFVDLGQIKSFEGSQNYAIPAGVDLKSYPSVVIWCKEFGVLISPADLTPL